MAGVSTLVGAVPMSIRKDMPWYQCLLLALATAIPGAYTELISKNGFYTLTVPLINAVVLLGLHL